ncbi:MAG TPA: hypothetical protein VFV92_03315 [Candidatus Bathyarchaeia archaeon]|nr:hypothetical protein [Candidatus Bathyarchaeia archaeon]
MIRYVFYSRVEQVSERFRRIWREGVGDKATYENASLGWYCHMRGSYEGLYVGDTEPDFKAGDLIRITIQRIDPNERPRSDNGRPSLNNEGARVADPSAAPTQRGENVN